MSDWLGANAHELQRVRGRAVVLREVAPDHVWAGCLKLADNFIASEQNGASANHRHGLALQCTCHGAHSVSTRSGFNGFIVHLSWEAVHTLRAGCFVCCDSSANCPHAV
jgi:hypothetical protein